MEERESERENTRLMLSGILDVSIAKILILLAAKDG